MEEGATNSTSFGTKKEWTAPLAFQSVSLFLLAALLEILGGWLVWQFCREKRPIWYLFAGCGVLIGYGVVPTFQPLAGLRQRQPVPIQFIHNSPYTYPTAPSRCLRYRFVARGRLLRCMYGSPKRNRENHGHCIKRHGCQRHC